MISEVVSVTNRVQADDACLAWIRDSYRGTPATDDGVSRLVNDLSACAAHRWAVHSFPSAPNGALSPNYSQKNKNQTHVSVLSVPKGDSLKSTPVLNSSESNNSNNPSAGQPGPANDEAPVVVVVHDASTMVRRRNPNDPSFHSSASSASPPTSALPPETTPAMSQSHETLAKDYQLKLVPTRPPSNLMTEPSRYVFSELIKKEDAEKYADERINTNKNSSNPSESNSISQLARRFTRPFFGGYIFRPDALHRSGSCGSTRFLLFPQHQQKECSKDSSSSSSTPNSDAVPLSTHGTQSSPIQSAPYHIVGTFATKDADVKVRAPTSNSSNHQDCSSVEEAEHYTMNEAYVANPVASQLSSGATATVTYSTVFPRKNDDNPSSSSTSIGAHEAEKNGTVSEKASLFRRAAQLVDRVFFQSVDAMDVQLHYNLNESHRRFLPQSNGTNSNSDNCSPFASADDDLTVPSESAINTTTTTTATTPAQEKVVKPMASEATERVALNQTGASATFYKRDPRRSVVVQSEHHIVELDSKRAPHTGKKHAVNATESSSNEWTPMYSNGSTVSTLYIADRYDSAIQHGRLSFDSFGERFLFRKRSSESEPPAPLSSESIPDKENPSVSSSSSSSSPSMPPQAPLLQRILSRLSVPVTYRWQWEGGPGMEYTSVGAVPLTLFGKVAGEGYVEWTVLDRFLLRLRNQSALVSPVAHGVPPSPLLLQQEHAHAKGNVDDNVTLSEAPDINMYSKYMLRSSEHPLFWATQGPRWSCNRVRGFQDEHPNMHYTSRWFSLFSLELHFLEAKKPSKQEKKKMKSIEKKEKENGSSEMKKVSSSKKKSSSYLTSSGMVFANACFCESLSQFPRASVGFSMTSKTHPSVLTAYNTLIPSKMECSVNWHIGRGGVKRGIDESNPHDPKPFFRLSAAETFQHMKCGLTWSF